jgi:hypothetical protein
VTFRCVGDSRLVVTRVRDRRRARCPVHQRVECRERMSGDKRTTTSYHDRGSQTDRISAVPDREPHPG